MHPTVRTPAVGWTAAALRPGPPPSHREEDTMRCGMFAALILGTCLGLALPAAADTITLEYTFEAPTVTPVKIADAIYYRVTMPGTTTGGNAGEPALPASGARALLPLGHEAVAVDIIASDAISLGEGYVVEPVAIPHRLSADPTTILPPQPDAAIYAAATPFPGHSGVVVGTHAFRGHPILNVRLDPVQYVPATGELTYTPRIMVVVETAATGRAVNMYRGFEVDRVRVASKIDNSALLAAYPTVGLRDTRSYDMLILTTPSLASAFQPLADHHTANGLATEIHTTSDVGSTNADDIRDYIRDAYLNDGIQFVIIGGDDDVIPAKDLYVEAYSGGDIEYSMPGDIYYACLDGTYNNDGDSYWGEPTDGPGGGDVDLVAEVYVGRCAAGNTTEVNRFVTKTLWYLSGNHPMPEKVQLVGEHLGFGGPAEYAGDTLEELIDGCSNHGYTTVGIPSADYVVDELFERDQSWSKSDLAARINAGVHLLNHLGHGSPDYAMMFYNSDVLSDLTNTALCMVYSQTCLAGHFDGTDCWAETAHIKTDHGAFAVIMNARYGWGTYNSTDGPSQRFNREFWDAMFNSAENLPELGMANQDSKEDNLYRINDDCMRWITYELTLFGDPTIIVNEITGLRVAPASPLESEGPRGGPFAPASKTFTLENMGPDAIDFTVSADASWVDVDTTSGTLPNVGDTADVVVSIAPEAATLSDGVYTATVTFTNTTSHDGDTVRTVQLKVGTPEVIYEWPLDSNPGWTTEAQWAFGQPTGGAGDHGGPDPTSGHTGPYVYGYNLSGGYSDSMGEETLTSEAIDCTGLFDTHLKFYRWLGVESPTYDHARVRVSNDGVNFVDVWSNGEEIQDTSWVPMDLDISDIADDQPTVYLQWVMGTTDSGWTWCGWNIDDIQIEALGGEDPPLVLVLPNGTPEYVAPQTVTPITVNIFDGLETYVADSATLHYRLDGGTFQTTPLTHIDGSEHQAYLPGGVCTDTPEFYISAEGDGGTTVFSPKNAPVEFYTAIVGSYLEVINDNGETDLGWTSVNLGATTGDWTRGTPVNDPDWDYDPASDGDGSGKCFLTANALGNTDVDGGAVQLVSPILDFSIGGITFEYDYFLRLTSEGEDFLTLELSSDGGPWIELARHGTDNGLAWTHVVITQDDLDAAGVTLTDNVQLRFTANDSDPQSIVEAGVDGVRIISFSCDDTMPPTPCPGDYDCNGMCDYFDIEYMLAALNGESEWRDLYISKHGVEPICRFADNCDPDGQGDGTTYFDIEAFLNTLGEVCPN